MSGKLGARTGRELIGALQRMGFEVVRLKRSLFFLRHPDGRSTVVLVHRGETIGKGLLSQILRDCEITKEPLRRFF
ncbi:MAG: type II toxin-antitoxin system HicA family toxin [Verrucomicrobiae bacterium]|nr:type II toxin-antitoxin system HicA family toxin [Verrucomicrobiae bacterium]